MVQLVSYFAEQPMTIEQELCDQELCRFDVLVRIMGNRFGPGLPCLVLPFLEDADLLAEVLNLLHRAGYPNSSLELICQQFIRPQFELELQGHMVVAETQLDCKLQTLIEVCTNFTTIISPIVPSSKLHLRAGGGGVLQ